MIPPKRPEALPAAEAGRLEGGFANRVPDRPLDNHL
jgi:hypothetical protein